MSNIKETSEFNKLYNKLLPSISRLSSSYFFLELSQEQFDNLAKGFLIEIYNKQGTEKLEKDIYIKKLRTYLDAYVKIFIKEAENTNIIINNYINKKLSISDNNKQNIKELKKLSTFLEKYDFIPTPDTCVELIKSNQTLSSIIQTIVNKNLHVMMYEGIDSIDDNEIVIMLIDVYCMLNNITYQKEEDEEESEEDLSQSYDPVLTDPIRMYLSEIRIPILTPEEEKELDFN